MIFKILWNISWKLGYNLQEKGVPPKPTERVSEDPRTLPYLQDLPLNTVYLPTELGVGLRFFTLNNKYHPFIVALELAKKSGYQEKCVFEILKHYNQLNSLMSANDFFGLCQDEVCFSNDNHPYEYTYPWSPLTGTQIKENTLNGLRTVNLRYGLNSDESIELLGASDDKIKIEAKRLTNLIKSIQQRGFDVLASDPIGCFVLLDGKNWRWHVQGGQHRAAVLAVLGYKKMPVYVRRIIRREDVNFWPNVQAGLFSKEQALTIFDKLFLATPPLKAQDWVTFVNKSPFYNNQIV